MQPIPIFSQGSHTVRAVRERALIRKIRIWLEEVAPPCPVGMGDDCAVLDPPQGKLLLAMDPVLYGKHFDDSAPAALVGAKLLKRNLSDIAAMGGMPDHALLGLICAGEVSLDWLEHFFHGLRDCARRYGVTVVGGDVAEGPPGTFHAQLTLTGHAPRAIPRLGGQIGDSLWVTGQLGGSRAGHHLHFTPRLAEGQWLAAQSSVRGLIDLTDGLATDLPKLLPPGSIAAIDAERIPISDAAQDAAEASGDTPLSHALGDGEDYELAFVLDQSVEIAAFAAAWHDASGLPLAHIGHVAPLRGGISEHALVDSRSGAILGGDSGFEHFGGA